MKTLVLIFGVITNDGQIELVKVPDIALKNINSCEKAIENNSKWVLNPNYEPGNYEVWGFYTYQNRVIMLQYCTESGGEHGK
jgi:hypothetical protein